MIITIADAVFGAVENSADGMAHLELLSLLQLGREGRHHILVDPLHKQGADREVNRWLAGRDQIIREAAELAFKRGGKGEAHFPLDVEIRVDTVAKADWEGTPPSLPLSDALELAKRPLEIFVEDWQNDGQFLRLIAPAMYASMFEKALDKKWIKIGHGGGTGLLRRVQEVQGADYLRIWMMFDSDARSPGKPSKYSEDLKEQCSDRQVCHHRLGRRAIENYLPKPALDDVTAAGRGRLKRPTFEAFWGMDPSQRHHYNLKKGFQGDSKDPQGDPMLEHFGAHRGLPELQTGFGKDIWEDASRKYAPPFEESWLEKDQSLDEAKDILRSILQRL